MIKNRIKTTIIALTIAFTCIPVQKTFALQAVGEVAVGRYDSAASSAFAGFYTLFTPLFAIEYGIMNGNPGTIGFGVFCGFWCPFVGIYFLDSNPENSAYYFQFKDLKDLPIQMAKNKFSMAEINSYQEEREILNALSEQLVTELNALTPNTSNKEEWSKTQVEYSINFWKQYENQLSPNTFSVLRKLVNP